MQNLTFILVVAGIVLISMIVVGLILARLYKRATKEHAFVRTGFGGQKVILNGGALVLPVLHDLIWVCLNTLKLEIRRKDSDALITKDRMRVDVTAEFYVRVKPDQNAIAFAAQTLGDRTLKPERLKELMEGKFVDALRAVAAEMAMEELHEQRSDFVQRVQNAVSEDLTKNGLELETVSLTGLDQTDIQYFNEANAFDAEGKTRLTEIIESRRKKRNDIEKENEVQIAQRNLEAQQKKITIAKEEQYAHLEQQREIQNRTAQENASIAAEKAARDRESQEAHIAAKQAIDLKNIEANRKVQEETLKNDQAVQETEIAKEKAVELANQQYDIDVAKKSEEQSKAKADAEVARAKAVAAEEQVETAKQKEVADRQRAVAVIKAREGAESEAAKIKVAAEAEKQAAADRADAVKVKAQAEADAVVIKADADERRYAVEAEGQEKLNMAENSLSPEIVKMRVQLETVHKLEGIITASVKPIEAIDSMKVINVGGLQPSSNGSANGKASSGGENITSGLMNGLLNYRAQAPIIDALVQSLGLGQTLNDVVSAAPVPTAPAQVAKPDNTESKDEAVAKPKKPAE